MSIPGYQILRRISHGGMATVYLAEQESVGRQVALKVLTGSLGVDPQFSERFLREARYVARLSHPNIIALYDMGEHEGQQYIAMEYLPEASLRERIGHHGMPPREALPILRQLASALECAHQSGIVHRDVKPDNVLFRSDGSVVLTDFGIATSDQAGVTLTQVGLAVGTPQYMSPEQAQGKKVDHRADLYSLGILLHEMLTGRPPFTGEDPVSIGVQHVTASVPRLPAPLAALQPLLDSLLAKSPDDRPADARAVLDQLTALEHAMTAVQPSAGEILTLWRAMLATTRAWIRHQLGQRTSGMLPALGFPDSREAPTRLTPALGTSSDALPASRTPMVLATIAMLTGTLLLAGVGWLWWEQHTGQPLDAELLLPVIASGNPQDSTQPTSSVTGEAADAAPTPEAPEPIQHALTVLTEPTDARVQILNIKPRYEPGMRLAPGEYRVRVSHPGHGTVTRTLTLRDADLEERIALTPLADAYPVGRIFRDDMESGLAAPEVVVLPAPGAPTLPGFAMTRYEITRAEFAAFARQAGIPAPTGDGRLPALGIDWEQARRYARWLSERTGHTYRLPTNREWEYAASGNRSGRYWWGDEARTGMANCRYGCGAGLTTLIKARPVTVGRYAANGFGLHDTAGNAAEWTLDCFYDDPASNRCDVRTVRGGSYLDNISQLTTRSRAGIVANAAEAQVGFRLLRELDIADQAAP